jgi:type IV secretory pathway VirD2 relaxase
MVRNAAGYQQAILKVYGYSKTKGHLSGHIRYISRNNELELEDPTGNKVTSGDEVKELLGHWFADADKRKNSRMSANMVLSAPRGADPDAAGKATRDFARETFVDNHDYLFTIHDDTSNPHAHLIVKLRGYDGTKLRLGRQALYEMRQNFAQCLRERGVEVAATYRSDRGVGRRGENQKIINMRRRGIVPEVDKGAISDAAESLRGRAEAEPWVLALAQKNKHVRAEYAQVGQALMKSDKDNVRAIGRQLYHFAREMPDPETRKQALMRSIIAKVREQDQAR